MSKLAVVGSFNQDMTFRAQRIPRPGETVHGNGYYTGCGGKGSNQAIAAFRQGADLTAVLKLGRDAEGENARALYRKLGIPSEGLLTDPDAHTGVAGIFEDTQGNNCIIVQGGANLTLRCEEILSVLPPDTTLAGFQLENDPDEIFAAIRSLHGQGVHVLLDPAPAVPLPDRLYPCLTYLKPNEFEASLLTGLPVTNRAEAERAAEALVARGTKNVIVTLGKAGCVVRGEANGFLPAFPVEAVDSTGAGDVFSGTMLALLSKGEPLLEAARMAAAAAALSVTKLGVWQACPTAEETRAFYESRMGNR